MSFSHVDGEGRARMVDVGGKPLSQRVAKAQGFIELNSTTLAKIRENEIKKGDVLRVAELAGIQGAKRTADLIPLCHPLLLNRIAVRSRIEEAGVRVESEVACEGRTGVEMEALTAVQIALLTIYDMCKAVDATMRITDVVLLEKSKEACERV